MANVASVIGLKKYPRMFYNLETGYDNLTTSYQTICSLTVSGLRSSDKIRLFLGLEYGANHQFGSAGYQTVQANFKLLRGAVSLIEWLTAPGLYVYDPGIGTGDSGIEAFPCASWEDTGQTGSVTYNFQVKSLASYDHDTVGRSWLMALVNQD